MTTPGNANLGTAYGKVRIEYESGGIAKASKDINQIGKDLVVANKAIAEFQKSIAKGVNLNADFKINVREISVDRASFNGAVDKWQRSVRLGTISLDANIKITPKDIQIDQGAITRAVTNIQRNQNLSVNSGMVVAVRVRADMNQVVAEANMIRNVMGRIISDQSAFGRGMIGSLGQGMNRQATQQGQQSGGLLMGGLAMGMKGGPQAAAVAAAVTAVGAGVAAAGKFLSMGFNRLEGLDQAAMKLKALGYQTGQIQVISKNALDAVRGTAFGLDQAFNAAANAISAGIKPGQELTDYLKNVADNAALAGTSMADMGDIFNQVAVQGKLSGDVIDSLQSRGVDVFGNLAKSMGVTQAKAQELATNGAIDFEKFRAAMNLNSGAAKTMGNTVSGSMENLWAAVSRIAALFLKPIFGEANGETSKFAQAVQFLTNALGKVEDWMTKNQGLITVLWGTAGKEVLYFAKGVLYVGGAMAKMGTISVAALKGMIKGWETLNAIMPFSNDITKRGAQEAIKALDSVGGFLDDVSKNSFGPFQDMLSKGIDAIDGWMEKAIRGGSAAAGAFKQVKKPAVELQEVLAKYGIKDNEFIAGLQGTTTEFHKFLKVLKEKGATDGFINFVKGMRQEFNNGGSAVKTFSEAIEKLGDSSATAADKADTLIASLKEMGVIPNDDVLQSYADYITKLGDAANSVIDPLSALGDQLVNVDGTLNKAAGKNESALFQILTEAQKQFTSLAASGTVNPEEAYGNIQNNLKDALTGSFGLSGDIAEKVISTYLPHDALMGALNNAGDPKAAAEAIFGKDPMKVKSVIDLLTKQDDILKTLIPEGVLKIPATIVAKPGSGLDWYLKAFEAATGESPGSGGGAGKSSGNSWLDLQDKMIAAAQAATGQTPIGNVHLKASQPSQTIANSLGINASSVEALNNTQTVNNLLGQNADLQNILGPQIAQAEGQGKNFAEAFAAGIDSASDEVKQAIIRLAGLAGDGLGHSPALYGPLSGKGWTLERGKVFTKAYASGISAASSDVKGAVSSMVASGVMPLSDRMTQTIKDMQEFSDLGKKFFDVGKQIADIAMNTLKFANDMSGGRLFPKHYIKDPLKAKKPDTSTGFNPQLQAPNLSALGGNGNFQASVNVGGKTIPLKQNSDGTWGSTDPEWDKLIKRESGGNASIIQGIQDSNSGGNEASGLFQIAKGTWASNGGTAFAPTAGEATPEQQAQIAAKIFGDQGVGPWGGRENEALLRAGLTGGQMPAPPKDLKSHIGDTVSTADGNTIQHRGDSAPFTPVPYGLKPGTNTGGYGTGTGATFPEWIMALGKAYGVTPSTYGGHQESDRGGEAGYAPNPQGLNRGVDWTGSREALEKFAKALMQYGVSEGKSGGLEQVIYQAGPGGTRYGLGGAGNDVSGGAYYDYPGGYDQHGGGTDNIHVHTRFNSSIPLGMNGIDTTGQPVPVQISGANPGALSQAGALDGIDLNAGIPKAIRDNPALMAAATGQGFGSTEARLQALDSQIADAERLNTPLGKAQADYLGGVRSKVLSDSGLKEAPSDLETAQSIISGGSGIVSSAFATIDSTIKAIGGAKDLGDTLVRGIKDTSDVNKVIDDFQTFLDLGSKIAQLTSDISGFASSMVGAAGAGDSSGSAQGVAMALGAVSTISGLVSQGFAAANAVIDLGQEVARIAGKYAGRAITSMLGFPGAQDMKFLLDTVTGQLQAYTSENPQDKHTFDTLGRKYNPDRYVDQRTGPANTFYIYQGPGQDPRDTMNDAMFAVKSSGMGTFGYGQQP